MGRNIKVACMTYHNKPADVAKGLKGCIDIWALLIDRAALDRPDIILLPESFAFAGLKYSLPDIAEPLPGDGGPITRLLAEKAARHNVYIYAGYYRKNGAHVYNSAVLFDRSGAVAGFYDKVFPTIGELEQGISPGKEAVVIETELGRLGAAVCFDFNFSELFLEYQRKRADLICFLSEYAAGLQLPIRAFQHHYHIASATPSIPCMIVNPLGRVLASSDSSRHSYIIQAAINLDCRVLHMDYNNEHVWDIKQKYGPKVMLEEACPEAAYLLTACDPDLSADEVIREFGLELFDDYLERARAERVKRLPEDEKDRGTS